MDSKCFEPLTPASFLIRSFKCGVFSHPEYRFSFHLLVTKGAFDLQGKTGHFFHLYIGIQQGATELRSFCFRSVTLTGPYFKDTEAVAKTLGLRSIRSNIVF